MEHVIIIGGGIGGLAASIALSTHGIKCTVIEKKHYPIHKVCGEYVSNEALPFLNSMKVFPNEINLPQISRLQLSSVNGKCKFLKLDLGGFGISRYYFDFLLYQRALESGVNIFTNTPVEGVTFEKNIFKVKTNKNEFESQIVIGAFGKRSTLDVHLDRPFIHKRSPYLGVKYHVECDYPDDLIALHNFNGGYCGVVKVENNIVNLCYLSKSEKLRDSKNIPYLEESVLCENPFLKEIFRSSKFLFDRPLAINEINFETKTPVDNHLLMVGDAAGMITPLCGNGMAMAIHSAKIVSELVAKHFKTKGQLSDLENEYTLAWNRHFRRRLWAGRQIQRLFGSDKASALAINLAIQFPPLADLIVRNTHGNPF